MTKKQCLIISSLIISILLLTNGLVSCTNTYTSTYDEELANLRLNLAETFIKNMSEKNKRLKYMLLTKDKDTNGVVVMSPPSYLYTPIQIVEEPTSETPPKSLDYFGTNNR